MPADDPSWRLTGFSERLDAWIDLEQPDPELRRIVIRWLLTRMDDPYQGARREAGFPNLWWAVIPGSIHSPARVVGCAYWVFAAERTVRCDQISSLSFPA
jgi:hypothetical protein